MRTKNTYSLEDEQDRDAIKEICTILSRIDDANLLVASVKIALYMENVQHLGHRA